MAMTMSASKFFDAVKEVRLRRETVGRKQLRIYMHVCSTCACVYAYKCVLHVCATAVASGQSGQASA